MTASREPPGAYPLQPSSPGREARIFVLAGAYLVLIHLLGIPL